MLTMPQREMAAITVRPNVAIVVSAALGRCKTREGQVRFPANQLSPSIGNSVRALVRRAAGNRRRRIQCRAIQTTTFNVLPRHRVVIKRHRVHR